MTRDEYMAYDENDTPETRAAKHHQYYMQFVNLLRGSCASFCHSRGYTLEVIQHCLATDHALNNLPGAWNSGDYWLDAMDRWARMNAPSIAAINNQLNGTRTWCMADGACILKAYMRDIAQKETNHE